MRVVGVIFSGASLAALPQGAAPAAPVAFLPAIPPPALPPFVAPDGMLLTRVQVDALFAAFSAGGLVPLSAAQVLAITGPGPVFPASLPVFEVCA